MKYTSQIHKNLKLLILVSIIVYAGGCTPLNDEHEYQKNNQIELVNTNSTYNTSNLFINLKRLSESYVIFGHHHSTFYGIGWRGETDRSDVKDVSGSHPGLIGWDFEDFVRIGDDKYKNLRRMVIDAHEQGIVNIFCWHYANPVTGGSFYDTTTALKYLLPGSTHNTSYNRELDRIATFAKHLIGEDGKVIPIILRTFHEMDVSWFWWGKNFCTAEEYISLWKYTVNYLKDYRNVKNILFAFSPDRNFNNEHEYFLRYPGDEYADILGMDNYWDFTSAGEELDAVKAKLKIISRIADRKNKIAAFTETGLERIPDEKWWTDKLFYSITDDSIKIAFLMVWRNAHKNHFYAPYSGHSSSRDFIDFKNDHNILFSDKLPNLFKEILE